MVIERALMFLPVVRLFGCRVNISLIFFPLRDRQGSEPSNTQGPRKARQ